MTLYKEINFKKYNSKKEFLNGFKDKSFANGTARAWVTKEGSLFIGIVDEECVYITYEELKNILTYSWESREFAWQDDMMDSLGLERTNE